MIKQFVLLVISSLFLAGCGGSGGGSSGGASSTPPVPGAKAPVSETPSVSPGKWVDPQAACLDDNQKAKLNSSAQGTNAQCVDFSNQDLTGTDFSGYDLRGANFHDAILLGVNLNGAIIKGLVLDGAEIDNACLLQWLTSGSKPASMTGCSGSVTPAAPPSPSPLPPVVDTGTTNNNVVSSPPPAPTPDPVQAPPAPQVSGAAPNPSPAVSDISPSPSPSVVSSPPPPPAPAPVAAPNPSPIDQAINDATAPPPQTPSNTPPLSNISEDILPSSPPLLIDDPTPPPSSPLVQSSPEPTHISDPDIPQLLTKFDNAADLEAYFVQVEQDSQLGRLSTQLKLTSLRMQRHLDQSILRINALKLKEDTADLNTAGADTAKLNSNIGIETTTHDSLQAKVADLLISINDLLKIYKEYTGLHSRAVKVVKLVHKFSAKYSDLNARLENGEVFATTMSSLETQNQDIQAKIASLKNQQETLKQTVADFDNKIAVVTGKVADFSDQIAAQSDVIKNIQTQIAALKGKSDAKKSLQDQKTQAQQVLADLKAQQDQLQAQLADLRTQRALPKQQIDQLSGQIQAANQELDSLKKQLREAKVLGTIYKLLIG